MPVRDKADCGIILLMKKYASTIITAGFLALFVWYGLDNKDSIASLKAVAPAALLLIAAGKLLTFLSNGLFTKWTAEAFTRKFTLGEGAYISVLSAVGNFFGPLLGGTSIRAVYLKKNYDLSYSKFTSTLMGYYLILFTANSLLALVSLFLLPRTDQTVALMLFFGVWLLVLAGFTVNKLPKREKLAFLEKTKPGRFIVKVLYEIEDGWQALVRDRKLMLRLGLVTMLSLSATLLIVFVEFSALSIAINLPAIGLYTSLVTLSLLLSLTPGAIGIREAILLIVASTIGITSHQIIQIAIIDRGVHFLLLLILFVLIRTPAVRDRMTPKKASK